MARLGEDIQLIIQMEQAPDRFKCEGFSGIPVVNPCLIVLASAGTVRAQSWTEILRKELIDSVAGLSQGFAPVTAIPVPCGGTIDSLFGCHAHGVSQAQKLLVLVGDPTVPFSQLKEFESWAASGPSYQVLPVFPNGADVPGLLSSSTLQLRNAVFWQTSVTEVVPEILASVGLTAEEQRIFISYFRPDTRDLADQLFDALSRDRFDVYLDRFRTPPATDFKTRLEQELADKAMVLVLESPNLMGSRWCQHEISFAKRHRLGVFALQSPGGVSVPGIDSRRRLRLAPGDFTNQTKPDTLTSFALQRVVQRIKDEHSWTMVYRRWFIRQAMILAIQLYGLPVPVVGADGLLRMQSPRTSQPYAFWLTTRSPDLSDFHKADINCLPNERGVVIGPGVIEAGRRDRLVWLGQKSKIRYEDEAYILSVARDAKEGRL